MIVFCTPVRAELVCHPDPSPTLILENLSGGHSGLHTKMPDRQFRNRSIISTNTNSLGFRTRINPQLHKF